MLSYFYLNRNLITSTHRKPYQQAFTVAAKKFGNSIVLVNGVQLDETAPITYSSIKSQQSTATLWSLSLLSEISCN